MAVITIDVSDITVRENYHRKDLGKIEALAESIKNLGLLQPIMVIRNGEPGFNLVFGLRRLEAHKIAGLKEIEAKVIDPTNLTLQMENDENELRKDFTISEKVAIAASLKEYAQNIKKSPPLPDTVPIPEGRTREVVAKAAGFGNPTTMDQATKVVENGTDALVDAMDAGDVSIYDASKVADLPKKEQAAAVNAKKTGKTRTARGAKSANGKPEFDDRIIEKLIGQLMRAFDDRAAALGKGREHQACIDSHKITLAKWNQWQVKGK